VYFNPTFVFLFWFLLCRGLYGQIAEMQLTYEVKLWGALDPKIGNLYVFDSHSTYFHEREQRDTVTRIETKISENHYHTEIIPPASKRKYPNFFVQTDLKSNMVSATVKSERRRAKQYFLKENFYPLEGWTFHSDVKVIGGYSCNKATTNFSGREYEVWYTIDIPINVGPWKLHGLPGAMVSVIDKDKRVSFQLQSIRYREKAPEVAKRINIKREKFIPCERRMQFQKDWQERSAARFLSSIDRDQYEDVTLVESKFEFIQTSCN